MGEDSSRSPSWFQSERKSTQCRTGRFIKLRVQWQDFFGRGKGRQAKFLKHLSKLFTSPGTYNRRLNQYLLPGGGRQVQGAETPRKPSRAGFPKLQQQFLLPLKERELPDSALPVPSPVAVRACVCRQLQAPSCPPLALAGSGGDGRVLFLETSPFCAFLMLTSPLSRGHSSAPLLTRDIPATPTLAKGNKLHERNINP